MITKLVAIAAGVLIPAICTSAAGVKPLYVDPACPIPGEDITVRAALDPSQVALAAVTVSRNGSTITLVLPTATTIPLGTPQVFVPADIGPLSLGTYSVEFYVSPMQASGTPSPDQLVATTTFVVQDNPPVCEARHVVPLTYAMVSGLVGQPYPSLLSVRAVDAHGLPVPGVTVYWQPLMLAGQPAPGPQPDLVAIADGTTDAQGVYAVQAAANTVAGTFEYQASIDYANLYPSAYYVISNRPAPDPFPVAPVVEYYDGNLSHFFITAYPAEMAKLDAEQSGWLRTGGVFLAYGADPATRPSDTVPVCRFYGLPQAGLDSHFFSASAQECAEVTLRFGNAWLLETDDAFGILLPDMQTGSCPPGTLEVHRLYNNRPDANHRYGVAPLYLLSPPYFAATGPWIPEGYGPDAVVMCAPA
jgi:hypothetical protein